ncbi:hypothetical protein C8F01DRAFT_1174591, partial [Mycena amicta]
MIATARHISAFRLLLSSPAIFSPRVEGCYFRAGTSCHGSEYTYDLACISSHHCILSSSVSPGCSVFRRSSPLGSPPNTSIA